MKFLESALKPKTSGWLYLLGVFIAFVAMQTIGGIPLGVIVFKKMFSDPENIASISSGLSPATLGVSPNVYLIAMMFPFVIGLLALVLLIKPFHKRTYKEVINGTNSIRWSRVWWGAGVWTVLLAAYLGIDYAMNPANYVFQFNISTFIPLVIIAFLLIPLQTSFEELTMRGYLAQGLAGATGSRWIACLLPSVVFGLLHSFNPEIAEHGFWVMMSQYILAGVVFAIMSILDDGIELSMGMHAANNIFLCLFVTNASSALQTDAVFNAVKIEPLKELIVLIITSVLVIGFFYKKYNWNFSILNKKVALETPPPTPSDLAQ